MDCTTAGWLWYCDPHDTHGNADTKEEAEATADGHRQWWAANQPDDEPCYIITTAVDDAPLGELVTAAIYAPSDNRTIGGRVRDAEDWRQVWSAVLEERGMSLGELADRMGRLEPAVVELLAGQRDATAKEAVAFAAATGSSSSLMWQVVADWQLRQAQEEEARA